MKIFVGERLWADRKAEGWSDCSVSEVQHERFEERFLVCKMVRLERVEIRTACEFEGRRVRFNGLPDTFGW